MGKRLRTLAVTPLLLGVILSLALLGGSGSEAQEPTGSYTISGIGWVDTNENAAIDSGEVGYIGTTVALFDSNSVIVATETADATGTYSFVGLEAGTYTVRFDIPPGYKMTTFSSVVVVTLPPSTTVNFGIAPKQADGAPHVPGFSVTTFASVPRPRRVTFDGAGNLFTIDRDRGEVFKITPTGEVSIVADLPDLFSGYNGPHFDQVSGNLFVSRHDHGTGTEVLKVTGDGVVSVYASGLPGAPSGLTTDAAGNLFVATRSCPGSIFRVTPSGDVSNFASGLCGSDGLAFGPGGDLFIADRGTNRIMKVPPSGGRATVFASGFPLHDHNTNAVAFDAMGNLFVTNGDEGTISKVSPTGTVSAFGSGLSGPFGLAFDASGNLFVAEFSGSVISRVAPASPTFSDDFNDDFLDTSVWQLNISTGFEITPLTQVAEINQRIEITHAAGSSGQGPYEVFGGGIMTRCKLSGDFDVQVDFKLLEWPSPSGVRVGIGFSELSGVPGFALSRNNEMSLAELYAADFGATRFNDPSRSATVATTDLAGTLRLVRSGSTLSGFFYDSTTSDWRLLKTITDSPIDDVQIFISSWGHSSLPGEVKVSFDDFRVNTGSLDCPPPGLVSWWPGDGHANDILGGNHGTLHGGTTFTQGMVGQAFGFDGVNDYVEVPDDNSLDLVSEITMEAWVNPGQQSDSIDCIATEGGIILNKELSYEVAITQGTNTVRWALAGPTGNPFDLSWFWYDTSVLVNLNEWNHVAVTYSSITALAKTYINGELVDSYDVRDFPSHYSTDLIPSDLAMNIGARTIPETTPCSGTRSFFNGLIDEVSIYNRALTDAEIKAIYEAAGVMGISGKVWVDTNRNGAKDEGESDYPGATVTLSGDDSSVCGDQTHDQMVNIFDIIIYLQMVMGGDGSTQGVLSDLNDDGAVNIFDVIMALQYTAGLVPSLPDCSSRTTSDESGSYSFANLPAGDYTVTLTVPEGYDQTTVNPRQVSLPPSMTVNFGIAPVVPFQFHELPVAFSDIDYINWYGNTEFAYQNRCPPDGIYQDTQGFHSGVDFIAPYGTAITSVVNRSGIVRSINNDPYDYKTGPGNLLIDYGDFLVLYGHISGVREAVTLGVTINPDETVAYIGADTSGLVHLHLEVIRKNPLGSSRPGDVRTNPVPFFSPTDVTELKEKATGIGAEFHPIPGETKWQTPEDQPDIIPGGPLFLPC